uniref:Im:7152348 n=1 Tax=Oryzias sinensis TaxID=183150 RepID=A0A8C8DSZ8_9TELE
MVLCEDSDCTVCFFPYSRMDRIPRVLHCRHTFCELCLEAMQQVRSSYLAVACPLCRRVTCIDRGLSLQDALWVDSKLSSPSWCCGIEFSCPRGADTPTETPSEQMATAQHSYDFLYLCADL